MKQNSKNIRMICISCGKYNFRSLFYKNNYEFKKCKNCGLVYLYPLPSELQLAKYYESKAKGGNYDLTKSIERDRSQKRYLDLILKEKKSGNFLDIGCWDGKLLEFANESGFDVYGLELQKEAAKKALDKFPNKIHCGVIEKSQDVFPKTKFSVIVALGVIEHLRSPESLIKFVDNRLEDDGLFVIQTPNEGSLIRKIMGNYWFCWSAPEHTFYFSLKSLSFLLKKYNLYIFKKNRDIKLLRIGYIIDQLSTFGSEIFNLIKPLENFIPIFIKNRKLPAYGGEMILMIKKKN